MAVDNNYPLALPEGTILAGQYAINKVLGQGGFGITYKATDHKTNKFVAVKEFFPDTLAYREGTTVISYPGERAENYDYGKEGFLQEAQTLAEFIGCDGIVRIYSYFEENGTAYFVMDYIEGISFDEYLKQKGGQISCEEAKKILLPIMDALAVVHSKGIVHRDVTPDNIYITDSGEVKLLDFGAARYSLGDKSRSLDVILKHGFAPKEQYTRRGKQGPFTDIYSLGATFYFALTGRRPPDSVDRLEEDNLIPPSSLGVDITEYEEMAILHALNVSPSDRYQTMTEFKNAFLNENAPVEQQYFTPPLQQPVQPAAQTAPVFSAASNEPGTPGNAKPKKSKTAAIIAAILAGVLLVTAAIIISAAIPSSKNTIDNTPENADYSSSASKSSSSGSSSSQPAVYVGDANIIGSVGNIQCGGIKTDNYFIDSNYHSIRTYISGGTKEVINDSNGSITNLVEDGSFLFFIYSHKVHYYDAASGKYYISAELQNYSAYYMYLYLSKDYFFIYCKDKDANNGVLYRVARSTGKEEDSIKIEYAFMFTFLGETLYYADDSTITAVSSKDFSKVMKTINCPENGSVYSLTASDNSVYANVRCKTASGTIPYLFTFDSGLNKYTPYSLESIVSDAQAKGCKNPSLYDLNMLGNQGAICVADWDVEDKQGGLYHIYLNDKTITTKMIMNVGNNISDVNVQKSSNGSYKFFYILPKDGVTYYRQYDSSGKFINPE